ncbi:MAG: DUF4389 domain-containing protein [Rhodobacteraceae bacterium]|nr:DUF4389 domain-containing protein [Paracoccaceae bacterium]
MKTPKTPPPEEPVVLQSPVDEAPPAPATEAGDLPGNIWLHGLLMLVMMVLLRIATALISLCAVIQFLWMLFGKSRNEGVMRFGDGLANWMAAASQFLSGRSDEKPFPWSAWK